MSKTKKTRNLTYISLFSSAGIGCYGFKKAHFDCVATAELLEKRLMIQRYNKKCKFDSGYILGDITNNDVSNKIFQEIEKWNLTDGIDVVIATPPCQGMSVANQKKGNELKRNSLVVKAIELIQKINPKIFIFENVFRFLKTTCNGIDGKLKTIEEEIKQELSKKYLYVSKVINFKNYGSNSSRTRTLVIGVRKDILNSITPFELLPSWREEKKLIDVIGSYPRLKYMDEFDENNPLHHFKPYDEYMLDWIKDLKEGESAFNNKNERQVPHKIIAGKLVKYVDTFGDKYKRQVWSKVAPCIHTANDCLASQNTIHPVDNRVFSISELMDMMTIPHDFLWDKINPVNLKTKEEKLNWIRKNQGNIRKCIGEAVPTNIFYEIALKIRKILIDNDDIYNTIKEFEISNSKREINAAFYTDKINLAYIYNSLPEFTKNSEISILEPSVGGGNFLLPLFKKYNELKKVHLTIIDIDHEALKFTKKIINKIGKPNNFEINFLNVDYLKFKFDKKFDLVIGNPPFLKITNNNYSNLFEVFWDISIKNAYQVLFVNPKYMLSSNVYSNLRNLLSQYVTEIIDFGENGFKGVKIETILIKASTKNNKIIKVESIPKSLELLQERDYIFSKELPFWIIYRSVKFDEVFKKLKRGIFKIYKNYEISNKKMFSTKEKNSIWVIKSKNISISNLEIVHIKNYDRYISKKELEKLRLFSQLKDKKDLFLIPNLTYYPRVIRMPKNVFVNGSVLIAELKDSKIKILDSDLLYFYTKEFREYYSIAFNFSTRTLNVDNNTINFFGILR